MTKRENLIPEMPFADLGLIVLDSFQKVGGNIDKYIVKKRKDKKLHSSENDLYSDDTKDSYLIDFSIDRFSDGEAKCVINESIRGKDIYIMCDIGNYSNKYKMYEYNTRMGPDEHLQDVKRVVSAIGGKARRITVLMPRLYASRQDTRHSRESLDCAMALQELQWLGVQNILTFDAHSSKVQNAIPHCGFENLFASYNILQKLLETEPDLEVKPSKMVIIAPDAGAMDRAIYYGNVLGLNVGMFYKRRDLTKVEDGTNHILDHEYVGPSLKNKNVLIIDDMIASGGTIIDLGKRLHEMGVNDTFVGVTFALFTKGIETFRKYHKKKYIKKLFATNLNYLPPKVLKEEWFEVVDMSKFIAKLIHVLNYDASASSFFDDTTRINQMLEQRGK